ncbi:hypothetical protein HELRODRAFT_107921 [Helobdella robusta]|uniref:Disease resistance R13L4/SHOC-2-like LRR domain-containing protein n=1 Tax=Helobdella robusta TaxID=6412 RepID=T1EED9_HELRO|nr:hypothetical protein HELRODRAFT_107921 [Helobdella robusta]ESN94677.1 hypothetical protein HELRODRAFT_107921 [Helobdella robusta]
MASTKFNKSANMKHRLTRPNASVANSTSHIGPTPTKDAVMQTLLKQARKSGVLNLSNRSLGEVPKCVWNINLDIPEEGKSISLDSKSDDRWWEQVDLTKLILASNCLKSISIDISLLPALTVLDIHDNGLSSLPDSLATLTLLNRLNISQNMFSELPKCVYQLKNLCSLQAQQNKISSIEDSIGYLINLEELDLSSNELTELSACVDYLTRLLRLNLMKNKIATLPSEIGSLKNLKILDASDNKLERLPEAVGMLNKLEILYLQFNQINQFPDLKGCTVLKELHLGKNSLQSLPVDRLSSLVSLKILDLKDNQLSSIPDEISSLEHLERFDASNNNLSTVPNTLGLMVNLKALYLDGNPVRSIRRDILVRGTVEIKKFLKNRLVSEQSVTSSTTENKLMLNFSFFTEIKLLSINFEKLVEIPESCVAGAVKCGVTQVDASKNNFSGFPQKLADLSKSLNELDLCFNKMTSVCDTLCQLDRLVFLNFSSNQLTSLPGSLKNLLHLREINLNMNRFTVFPACLYNVKSIEIIMLSDNKIEKIQVEDGLISLPRLSVLDLQNNNISSVPPTLGNCTQLRSLKLEGNSFRNPNASTLAKGTAVLLEYLRNRIPT